MYILFFSRKERRSIREFSFSRSSLVILLSRSGGATGLPLNHRPNYCTKCNPHPN